MVNIFIPGQVSAGNRRRRCPGTGDVREKLWIAVGLSKLWIAVGLSKLWIAVGLSKLWIAVGLSKLDEIVLRRD